MGVMLQAFFWNCPRLADMEYKWWDHICGQIPSLAKVGFLSLWLPPIHKAANPGGPSMGYDPYDYYDLAEFDQKGCIPAMTMAALVLNFFMFRAFRRVGFIGDE